MRLALEICMGKEEVMKRGVKGTHTKTYRYYLAGAYFLLLQIYVIFYLDLFASTSSFFWICNVIPFLFAMGFFTKNISLVRSLISLSLVIHIIWTIDFFSVIFFNSPILGGFTRYAFQEGTISILPMLAHLFSSSVALMVVYREEFNKKRILIYSFLLIVAFQLLAFAFTTPVDNVNCVYESCVLSLVGAVPFYSQIYPIGFFILLVLPGYFLQRLLFTTFGEWRK